MVRRLTSQEWFDDLAKTLGPEWEASTRVALQGEFIGAMKRKLADDSKLLIARAKLCNVLSQVSEKKQYSDDRASFGWGTW